MNARLIAIFSFLLWRVCVGNSGSSNSAAQTAVCKIIAISILALDEDGGRKKALIQLLGVSGYE